MATPLRISAFLIEDDPYWRKRINEQLVADDIDIEIAENARDGRALAERLWDRADVAILDVELDPEDKSATGPGIIMELKEQRPDSFGPECIVFTDYEYSDYYRLALDLGAAAYHVKAAFDRDPIAPYVRVLALRGALNNQHPLLSSKLDHIAGASPGISDVIKNLCSEVLGPAFANYLGVPYFILFTEKDRTVVAADNTGLLEKPHDVYHTLQALAQGKGSPLEPFSLDVGKLKHVGHDTTPFFYDFHQAALLPIALSNNLKLSIGIMPHDRKASVRGGQTNQVHLCKLLARHLRPTVLERIIGLWSHWTEQRATRTSMAKLCLSVGQEIQSCTEESDLHELESMGEDFNDMGQCLFQLGNERRVEVPNSVSVKAVVEEAWNWVKADAPKVKLEIPSDCSVTARTTDLEIIMSRLLQWFAYRSKFTPLDVAPIINITCSNTEGSTSIILEDSSQRLPKQLRDDLFAPFTQALSTPFTQIRYPKLTIPHENGDVPAPSYAGTGRYLPLYLAKILVEGRYQGVLQDQSDQIADRNYGHRIWMQLPAARVH